VLRGAAVGEVSQVVDHVIGADDGVVPFDDLALHLLNIGEGAATESDDVAVPHVVVGREPNATNVFILHMSRRVPF
jgi:hypothetical protein